MNVLLVSANREKSPYPVFPLGLAYLAAPLEAAGHLLRAVDLCFADEPRELIKQTLASFSPDAVVISIRNLDNVTWPGTRFYLDGIREIVEPFIGRAPVILGGSGFSLMPRQLLDRLGAEFGVVGEGEAVLPGLLERLERNESPVGLPGVLVRGEDGYLPPEPMEEIGRPERGLFQLERYHREGGMANLQTKRGCPFSCIYCTYPLLEGTRLRLRDVDDIVAEMRELVEGCGTEYIYFVDDIFNYPVEFAERLCRAIIADGVKVGWSAFINPGFITPELVKLMAAAGCDAVEFGSDSGSPAMLKNLGKSFGVAEILAASALCRDLGVDFAHYILFGGPGETRETVLESFTLMDQAEPTAVIGMTGIRIFPGTPLYLRAIEDGIITPETDLLEPVFYISPAIGEGLLELVTEEALKRKNWVVPGLEINMSDAMLTAMRGFKVRGPLWKLMKRLGRNRVRPMAGSRDEERGG